MKCYNFINEYELKKYYQMQKSQIDNQPFFFDLLIKTRKYASNFFKTFSML